MKLPKYIIRKMIKARDLNLRVRELTDEVYDYLDKRIDLTKYEGGFNSDDLDQMISCYIDYNEDDLEDILSIIEDI